jgi:hypothetical protein
MPFNSDTYFSNKARRAAFDDLAEARAVKARIASGEVRSSLDSPEHIQRLIKSARSHFRLYRLFRREAADGKKQRRRA